MKTHLFNVRLFALVGLLSVTLSHGYSYLFFTSPTSSGIYVSRLLNTIEHSQSARMTAVKIAGTQVVKEPSGIAADSTRQILYVVDANGGQPKLYAARIWFGSGGKVGVDTPVKIADNLGSNWVAVDFRGTVFFVANNQLWSIPEKFVAERLDDKTQDVDSNASVPLDKRYVMLYDGGSISGVSMPLGLAVDGYRLFWTNSENGQQDGTVAQGLEEPAKGDTKVTALATNLNMAHGICLSPTRIFYTDEEQNVFSTKLNGGPVVQITDKLQKPRGCVFDADGTVFVADNGDNKIVSFAGAASEMRPRKVSLALRNVPAPYGVAILQGQGSAWQSAAAPLHSAVLLFFAALGLVDLAT